MSDNRTLLHIRRQIAFYETEIAHLEESKELWRKKYEFEASRQLAVVRRVQYHIRLAQIELAYWRGMLADWVQS